MGDGSRHGDQERRWQWGGSGRGKDRRERRPSPTHMDASCFKNTGCLLNSAHRFSPAQPCPHTSVPFMNLCRIELRHPLILSLPHWLPPLLIPHPVPVASALIQLDFLGHQGHRDCIMNFDFWRQKCSSSCPEEEKMRIVVVFFSQNCQVQRHKLWKGPNSDIKRETLCLLGAP